MPKQNRNSPSPVPGVPRPESPRVTLWEIMETLQDLGADDRRIVHMVEAMIRKGYLHSAGDGRMVMETETERPAGRFQKPPAGAA